MYNEKVRNSSISCYCKMAIVVLVMCLSMHLSVRANNVRLNGTVKVTDVNGPTATLKLKLTWDNSWRDNFNWDAVWLFLKVKPVSGEWSHVILENNGHSATDDYRVMNGKNSNGEVVGVYVFLDKNDTRPNASTEVTLKWKCGTGYTKASFDKNQAFLLAQGIEMVYIPYGAYYLGDGASNNTLGAVDGKPLIMNGEGAIANLYQRASNGAVGTAVSNLNANYPKGYHGFYVMKYETSQEQYVTFLNTLTKAQQETLLGSSLASLSPGNYIFGSASQPSYRNGIVLSAKLEGKPYVFDNNLNGNGVYSEDGDGQCVACNYMSVNDAMAYASWAGLRPMSELEYERACRAPFPQTPEAREYVWNSNSGISRVTSITAKGKETEVAGNDCNVNSDNGLTGNDLGPVRCGLFAKTNTNQADAGATYWGVMEMAGNLQELVASVTHSSLSRTANGEGKFGVSSSNISGLFGLRGGGFSEADSLLRTSDRSEISAVASMSNRSKSIGFRLVRTLDDGIETVNPGAISLSGPLCPGVGSTVSETTAASVAGGLSITYIWSYSTDNGSTWTVIPNVTGNELTYSAFVTGSTYLFRRTAVCALGEASTQTSGITASALTKITAEPADTVNAPCSLSISVTATGTSLTYQWEKDGTAITGATSATYSKNPTAAADRGKYVCKVTGACGTVPSKEILVIPGDYEDDVLTDSRDGKQYKIRKMPDGHWWMVEDLRFGTCDASTFNSYYQGNIKDKIAANYYGVCIESTQPGAGYLYNWQAAMNSPIAVYGNSGNPSNADPNKNQGICPDGWHLPSGGSTGEFQKLYDALCNTIIKIYPGIGTFEGVLGGLGRGSSVSYAGSYGYYWSSTYNNANYACYMYFNSSNIWPQDNSYKYNGFAVRCVKNY